MGRLSGTSAFRREYADLACDGPRKTLTLRASTKGARITVAEIFVDAFNAVDAVMEAHGYELRKEDTGAYNCRKITGGNQLSIHAYGGSSDYNWQSNPYGKTLITDMPAAMVADILAIRCKDGTRVFRWGGNYTSVKDAMHFEVMADRQSIESGIDPGSVAGVGFTPTTGDGAASANGRPTIRLTDPITRGTHVGQVQQLLADCNHQLDVDKAYGPITAAHVAIFQEARGMVRDGVVGPKTWERLEADAELAKAAPEPEPEPEPKPPSNKPEPQTFDHQVAVRYGKGQAADLHTAVALAEAGWHVADHTDTTTAERVYLVGGMAAREFPRDLAGEVVEVVGADRLDTLARAWRIVRDRVAKAV